MSRGVSRSVSGDAYSSSESINSLTSEGISISSERTHSTQAGEMLEVKNDNKPEARKIKSPVAPEKATAITTEGVKEREPGRSVPPPALNPTLPRVSPLPSSPDGRTASSKRPPVLVHPSDFEATTISAGRYPGTSTYSTAVRSRYSPTNQPTADLSTPLSQTAGPTKQVSFSSRSDTISSGRPLPPSPVPPMGASSSTFSSTRPPSEGVPNSSGRASPPTGAWTVPRGTNFVASASSTSANNSNNNSRPSVTFSDTESGRVGSQYDGGKYTATGSTGTGSSYTTNTNTNININRYPPHSGHTVTTRTSTTTTSASTGYSSNGAPPPPQQQQQKQQTTTRSDFVLKSMHPLANPSGRLSPTASGVRAQADRPPTSPANKSNKVPNTNPTGAGAGAGAGAGVEYRAASQYVSAPLRTHSTQPTGDSSSKFDNSFQPAGRLSSGRMSPAARDPSPPGGGNTNSAAPAVSVWNISDSTRQRSEAVSFRPSTNPLPSMDVSSRPTGGVLKGAVGANTNTNTNTTYHPPHAPLSSTSYHGPPPESYSKLIATQSQHPPHTRSEYTATYRSEGTAYQNEGTTYRPSMSPIPSHGPSSPRQGDGQRVPGTTTTTTTTATSSYQTSRSPVPQYPSAPTSPVVNYSSKSYFGSGQTSPINRSSNNNNREQPVGSFAPPSPLPRPSSGNQTDERSSKAPPPPRSPAGGRSSPKPPSASEPGGSSISVYGRRFVKPSQPAHSIPPTTTTTTTTTTTSSSSTTTPCNTQSSYQKSSFEIPPSTHQTHQSVYSTSSPSAGATHVSRQFPTTASTPTTNVGRSDQPKWFDAARKLFTVIPATKMPTTPPSLLAVSPDKSNWQRNDYRASQAVPPPPAPRNSGRRSPEPFSDFRPDGHGASNSSSSTTTTRTRHHSTNATLWA